MTRLLSLPFFLFCINTFCIAQYELMNNIPLQIDGQNSLAAWAGGLNNPQFSEIDLNNDGIQDLVIYDSGANRTLTFLNNGTTGQVDYQYAPEYEELFPQNNEKFLKLRDFDSDGIPDVFFFCRPRNYPGGSLGVLKGSYDASNKIQFSPYDSTLTHGNNTVIDIFATDIPAVDDIDNDGDMDILAFSINPFFNKNITWYKNMSVENGNGGTTLEFSLHHECWGMISETGANNTVFLSPGIDSCADNPLWKSPRHAGLYAQCYRLEWRRQ